ncbi:MtnX-like HAD-IB family phosphatase [Chloroflexota bacterium]
MSDQTGRRNTLIQCDFDGTITEEDVSFILLDAFTDGNWRRLLEEYREGKISVGHLNREAFAMVKTDKQSMLDAMNGKVRIRGGFHEMVSYCRRKGYRLVIVSNGLDFYIDKILKDLSLQDIEVFAAQTKFLHEGLQVQYIGPDGDVLDEGFKEAYVDLFLKSDYRMVYAGNGVSDFPAASRCNYIFATDQLLATCKGKNVECTAFTDFNELIRGLELLL